MKIALTVWGNRISPVFDSAQTLLVAQIKNDKVIKKSYERFDSDSAGFPDDFKKWVCLSLSVVPSPKNRPT